MKVANLLARRGNSHAMLTWQNKSLSRQATCHMTTLLTCRVMPWYKSDCAVLRPCSPPPDLLAASWLYFISCRKACVNALPTTVAPCMTICISCLAYRSHNHEKYVQTLKLDKHISTHRLFTDSMRERVSSRSVLSTSIGFDVVDFSPRMQNLKRYFVSVYIWNINHNTCHRERLLDINYCVN